MTLIKSIFSGSFRRFKKYSINIFYWLFRKFRTYSINMLDLFAYNTYYTWISTTIAIISILSFGPVYNIIWNLIVLTWILGWIYKVYDKNKEIVRLEKALEATGQVLDYDLLVDRLAPIMHNIWAQDVYNLENPTQDEFGRANTLYRNLSESDKEHNKKKAQLIIDWLDEQ